MPISTEHVGRNYPPTTPYQVSAAKIGEFAAAIGDPNPAYAGDEATAPPTFAAVVVTQAWQGMFDDPELGLALHRIVHAEQRFSYQRPLRVGDRVVSTLTIEKVRARDTADFITTSARVETVAGELVCTATATFVHSKEAA
ncbi:FAS1-like dehydratase domain-containing protein [Microlunatus speluncae]|uniref:FAS1-like dehydratase domain-containing protein n=1 Tax=Microlunatus speluncae TaxID=2594267 RepID=UPI0012661C1C|nr:MaoC family dehydratase N-terminal domain-containing protein [Microlunatus speluncae]